MASLKDAEQLAEQLESLVGDLRSELQNGKVDFEKLVSISDEISERADGAAEAFSTVNDTLMESLRQIKGKASGAGQKVAAKAGGGS